MAIKKRPSTAAEFLAGAPDSAPSEPARERSGMKRGHRYQLSVSVTGDFSTVSTRSASDMASNGQA